ncbi:Radical SAM domain protein [Desulfamplus magnetovallimortis]|uniref:Radical SAM domain protein n=1 Tax=Desulfamplus magnetovallimortis TaxID=1246637 RepID=A0A1W1H9Q1_9BACT|nr:Radical SAM domain protein [Desulfamplus magnetovallimortis]
MSVAQLDAIYAELSKAISTWKKNGRISLTGGEPFLEFEKLLHILNKIEKDEAFYWAGILSNGTLIDDKKIAELTKFKKLKEVQISIDGGTERVHDLTRGKGSFSKAINGLAKLISAGIPTAVMFTLTQENAGSVADIIDLADRMGIDALTIERYTPLGNSESDLLKLSAGRLKEIYGQIKQKKKQIESSGRKLKIRTSRPLWHLIDESLGGFCPVGYSSLCIMHDGTAYPCRRLPIPLGNVLNDGIFKIWYKSDILWNIRRKNRMTSSCGTCEDLGRCGGCRAAAYAENGDYLAQDPLCWKYKTGKSQ